MRETCANIKFFVSEDGYCRAESLHPYEVIGTYLEEDIQRSPNGCSYVLDQIDQIRTGAELRIEGAGNAHSIDIEKLGVDISHLWTDEFQPVHLSLNEFEGIILQWCEFVKQHPSE